MNRPIVFINYTHDSRTHCQRARDLAKRLQTYGIETILDQDEKGPPAEQWPRWMLNQLDRANYVLMVCSETNYRRFRGHEEVGMGKGGTFEGLLIINELYNAQSRTNKFVPVLFSARDEQFIPEPLRGTTHYDLTSDDAFERLCGFLLYPSRVAPGAPGAPKPRKAGTPMTFPASSPDPFVMPSVEATSPAPPALALWQEKLAELQVAEAIACDPSAKFNIRKDIEEARARIRDLRCEPNFGTPKPLRKPRPP